jgi:hypothetical protein
LVAAIIALPAPTEQSIAAIVLFLAPGGYLCQSGWPIGRLLVGGERRAFLAAKKVIRSWTGRPMAEDEETEKFLRFCALPLPEQFRSMAAHERAEAQSFEENCIPSAPMRSQLRGAG